MSLVKKSSKIMLWFLLLAFLATSNPYLTYSQNISRLPQAGTLLLQSRQFSPVVLKGLRLDPNDPLKFNFIIDTGNDKVDQAFLKEESQRLINYFLAVLATPEDSLWVNLSPYEQNRIIPDGLEATEIGEGMLAQDYVLKQLAASLTYPETPQGKEYWKSMNGVGANNYSPVNNLNKVWIMPKTAVVAETPKGALIIDSSLQVKMEQENPAFRKNILPLIEKEVNRGKNFSQLRQIYSAMVLATWYKVRLKEAILNKAYANKEKFSGIDVADKADKEKIYQQYLKAFEVGAYNYIKRERVSGIKITKRQYFSGGVTGKGLESGFSAGTAVKIGVVAVMGLGAAGAMAAMHSSPAEAATLATVGTNFEVAAQVEPVTAEDLATQKKIKDDVKILTEKGVFESVKIDAGMRLMSYSPEKMVLDALEKAIGNKDFTPEEVSYAIWVYVYRLKVLETSSRQRALDFYRHNKGQFVKDWQEEFDAALAQNQAKPATDDDSGPTKVQAPKEAKRLLNSLEGKTDPGSTINGSAYQQLAAMGDSVVDLLEATLHNDKADTNVRKWAARLLGSVASPSNYERIRKILEGVINDESGKYQWWHKAEARNGLEAAKARIASRLGEKKSSTGGGAGFDRTQAIDLIKGLKIQSPAEAMSSPQFKKLARMGNAAVPFLKEVAGDLSYNTDVRKWAIRLLGETATKDSASSVVSFLRNVINNSSGLYQWWHAAEAKNAWNALYSKFPGKAPKPPTDHDFNQSITPSLVAAFYREKENYAHTIRYIRNLIAQGKFDDALGVLGAIMAHPSYSDLSPAEILELGGLFTMAENRVGGVKLSGRDLNLQRVGDGGEFKFNNSVNIDFKDGARALVLEVKPTNDVVRSIGLKN